MGVFNNIGENLDSNKQASSSLRLSPSSLLRGPLFLSYGTEDTDGGLYRWIGGPSEGFKTNGSNIIVEQDCTLLVLVNAIKLEKGDVALKIKLNNVIKQSYLAKNNRKNELISVNYVGFFKSNDVINIQALNVKNIQVTIYGTKA